MIWQKLNTLTTYKLGVGSWKGGGCTQQSFTGRLCHRVQPLNLLQTIFGRKGTPFV